MDSRDIRTLHLPHLAERRARAAAALAPLGAIVVIGAGHRIAVPGGQDQTYPFRVHPDYRWLTGRDGDRAVVAFDPAEDTRTAWLDFVPEVTELERLWEGREPDGDLDRDPGTRPLSCFAEWLRQRAGRPIVALGADPGVASSDRELATRAAELLLHARRPKDAGEVEILRRAARATAAGFAAARAALRPGVTERELQIELESAMFRAGADGVGYETLVGSGPNSAVLHFAPSSRVVGRDDLVLIDAGGAIGGYTSDVTRTFAAGSTFAGERRELWTIVAQAERRAIGRCRSGVEWRDVHRDAATELAEGLVSMGVMRGTPSDLVERDAMALFLPHGIGHMVGIGVRDAGGRLPGAPARGACCGVRLRVDLPLEAGYVMTVEPGIYFVGALLCDAERRQRFADCIVWSTVDRLLAMGIGGVRIEDNVLVTRSEPEVLTDEIPL